MTPRLLWRAAFLLAAPTVTTALCAQAPATLGPKIDKIFARFDRTSPGCGVGLGKDGKPLYIHGYGSANLEYRVPLTDSTILESGSVAKQFTAAALVLLAQDGRLSLDDDIRKYLPEVPSFGGQTITIRHLLTHTSGLRDQWGLLGIEGRGPGTQVHSPATTLDLVEHQKMLNFPVGSQYLYSNTGYALAGIIVQRVSGMSLDAFLQERIFRPLGMTHTQLRDDFTEIVPNRATAYSGTAQAGYHTDMPFTNMIGNGGVLSTMADLLKWNENFENPRVGGASLAKTMETPMRLTDGTTIGYALGLEVGDYNGVRQVGHSGSTAGYRTYLARYPEQHVSVAVWCNYAGANPTALAHQVVDLVLKESPAPTLASDANQRTRPAAGRPPTSVPVGDYVGDYTSDELDVHLTVVTRDGKLFVRRRPADEFELKPTNADEFQAPGSSGLGTLRFARDVNRNVTGFAIFAGRVLDVRFKRAVASGP